MAGVCAIWAMKSGDFRSTDFDGSASGLADAITYCGSNGVIHMFPGNSSIAIPTIPDGVALHVHEGGKIKVYGDGAREEYTGTGKRRNYYNVMDFDTVADAIAAVPSTGSRLYFPSEAGPYVPPTAAGWTINKPIEIYSDGSSINEGKGFMYLNSGGMGNKDSRVFDLVAGARFYLHDTVISNGLGTPATLGTGDAIRHAGATIVQDLFIERVSIFYAGRNALRAEGNSYLVRLTIKDSVFYGCKGDGCYLNLGAAIHMSNAVFAKNKQHGLRMVGCSNGMFLQFNAESNADDLTGTNYEGQAQLENCADGQITGCNFEDIIRATVGNALVLNACRGMVVGACEFDGGGGFARAIHLINGSKCNVILPNRHSAITEPVRFDDATNEVGNVVYPQQLEVGSGSVVAPAGHKNIVYGPDCTLLNFTSMSEIADPAAPAANTARLYVRDNGAGKTELVVRFATGAVQVIKTEV